MKFTGSERHIATDDLMLAVNAAVTSQRLLLIKGEPATGKTMLTEEVAKAFGKPLIECHIKSTTKEQQGLYEYAAVCRLRGRNSVMKRLSTSATTSIEEC